MSPEKLIERILSGEFDADDFWNLCGHFHKGYPIDHIQPILRSDNLETLSAAAFYANELGPLLRPYVKELTRLLAHPSAQARSDAIHGLKQCITDKDTDAMARIIFALDDPDPFVHRSVMSYLQHAGNNSAIYAAAKRAPGTIYEEMTKIIPLYETISPSTIKALISHRDPIARRIGAGLACRPIMIVDAERLDIAMHCEDAKGEDFVSDCRKRPKPIGASVAYVQKITTRKEVNRRLSLIDKKPK